METRPFKWITIKYKNDLFDVKWSPIDQKVKEIRSVDSEVNIAYLLSLEVKREIQEIIINKGTHHALQRVKANKCQPTY